MTKLEGGQNERARKQITTIVATKSKDTLLRTSDIADSLKYRYRGYNLRHVGSLLKERDDVEWVSAGLWRVV